MRGLMNDSKNLADTKVAIADDSRDHRGCYGHLGIPQEVWIAAVEGFELTNVCTERGMFHNPPPPGPLQLAVLRALEGPGGLNGSQNFLCQNHTGKRAYSVLRQ